VYISSFLCVAAIMLIIISLIGIFVIFCWLSKDTESFQFITAFYDMLARFR